MAANPMGKTRDARNPYLIYKNAQGWEWRVLKAYAMDPYKKYARWFCAVRSPMTMGGVDLGDTYIADVVTYSELTYQDPSVPDSMVPDPTRVPSADFF